MRRSRDEGVATAAADGVEANFAADVDSEGVDEGEGEASANADVDVDAECDGKGVDC